MTSTKTLTKVSAKEVRTQNQATLRLFNSILVTEKIVKEIPKAVMERTIKNGYIIDPSIKPTKVLMDTIEKVVGISGAKANASFHKSWSTVQNTPMEELIIQQIIHYITTYGYEALGVFSDDTVYIPDEKLELSEITEDIPLTVVKAMSEVEVINAIIELGSGIALSQDTLYDIMLIVKTNDFHSGFAYNIANRELKTLLYDFYGLVPTEPVEFLRHLISKLTDESLVIKNKMLIEKIKEADGEVLDTLIEKSPENLASIFLRFKPLFLAMKSISGNKTFFNQLRKKSVKMHEPLPEDFLNSITSHIKKGDLNLDNLAKKLSGSTIWRKIRLAYALKFRLNSDESIVYRVRSGRGYATGFKWDKKLKGATEEALNVTLKSISAELKKSVGGKTIYIPSNVRYALPASEKQFVGNLPAGTSVSVPEDMIVGIHWTDTNKRVDLDLASISVDGKIGWDADYRSGDTKVLFSGDNTNAPKPHGASELFYLKKKGKPQLMTVNYYNFNKGDEVETKIIVASEKPKNFDTDYMVDINSMAATANVNITQKQSIMGLIASVDDVTGFYFYKADMGNSASFSDNEQATHTRNYLLNRCVNTLDFREILKEAGATIVGEIPVAEEGEKVEYINLSPEALDKTTIINLVKGK